MNKCIFQKQSNFFILVLLVIGLNSCKYATVYSRSIRQNYFKISERKLTNYLLKNKIDTANSYFVNDSFYVIFFDNKFQSDSGLGKNSFRPIQFRVFDSSGKHINTWANCYGPISYFLKNTDDLKIENPKLKLILGTELKDYFPLLKQNTLIEIKDYDIVVLAFWEWYMGNYSIKMLKELQALPNLSNKKILLIKMNLDNSK
ncbi:MAG: hypothetical protein ACKVQB_03010 [Bacteroidia bacterium]